MSLESFHRSNIRRKKRESSQFPTLACFTRVKILSPRAHATFVTNACVLRVTRRARPFSMPVNGCDSWRVGLKILLQVVFDILFFQIILIPEWKVWILYLSARYLDIYRSIKISWTFLEQKRIKICENFDSSMYCFIRKCRASCSWKFLKNRIQNLQSFYRKIGIVVNWYNSIEFSSVL